MNDQAAFDLEPTPPPVRFLFGTKVEQETLRLVRTAKDAGTTAAAKGDPDLFDLATEAIVLRAETTSNSVTRHGGLGRLWTGGRT